MRVCVIGGECGIRIVGGGGRRHVEQRTRLGEVLFTRSIGQQAIMADAMQAFGEHVDEEAADKLVRMHGHRLVAAWPIDPVIFDFPVAADSFPEKTACHTRVSKPFRTRPR
jgi:hypothetical protein